MRALLSVYDKSGIAELAQSLHELRVELVSSGGTAKVITEAGIPVTDVADFTGYPAMLGHRVVTLHPRVHGGLLADRRDPSHLTDLETHHIDLIDIVVGNLYPFGADPESFDHAPQASSEDLIDIGGPAMLRAAAKNHEYVTALVDPADYEPVLEQLRNGGSTSPAMRHRLARKVFAHTSAYDAAIVKWFDETSTTPEVLPETIHLSLERAQDLRYGENPHQQGARYRLQGTSTWWDSAEQHSGLALSYLNLFDADAAWRLVHDLGDGPAVAIIKHANPCGVSIASDLATAYERAFACDPRSAFGGIVALNRVVDEATVAAIEGAAQADLIIAPGYEPGVIDRLIAKRKNTRLLTASAPESPALTVRPLSSGFLVQQNHYFGATPDTWQVVTDRQPTEAEMADAQLAWKLCSYVISNAIVLVKDGTAWGIGAGQQNRVESGLLAASKADGRAIGGACASDAFYPFADGVEAAADAGAAVVIQPGGSVRDEETIAAANARGISMIFTGERQFRH
ncbi:MAG: bifunctional phosphoribosylaminoimidazolecarboxamide formyltransferase/IMP cyclohydrolase [Acidimicrobiales bacterium]